MKKTMILAVLLINSIGVFAQLAQVGTPAVPTSTNLTPENKFSWGVKFGINFATLHGNGDNSDIKSLFCYNAGVALNIPIVQNFYMQTGMDFTNKGMRIKESDDYFNYEAKIKLAYLQVPLLMSYYFNLGNNVQWHFNFGPYFALGVLGSVDEKYSSDYDSESYSYDAFGDLSEDNMGLSRFDAGLTFATGILINKIYLGIQYDLGLANMCGSEYSSDSSLKSRTFSIRLGYNF